MPDFEGLRDLPPLGEPDEDGRRSGPDDGPSPHGAPGAIRLHWHRDADPNADRAWLVRGTIHEVGKGLLSRQWGTAKTFIALDLCGCTMTGEPFAGRRTLRRGGVLFIAPEGAFEIPVRLRRLVVGKLAEMIKRGDITEPELDPSDHRLDRGMPETGEPGCRAHADPDG